MTSNIVYVILAAGRAQRMGFAKTVAPLAGRSPLERLADMLGDRPTVIVASPETVREAERAMPKATVLENPDPSRGMSSSLAIADASLEQHADLGVLLADKPFVRVATLERCESELASDPCDVLIACTGGVEGHPVYFSRQARERIAALPAGDTLRALRDDAALVRRRVACDDDPGVLHDLDTPQAWRAAERQLRAD